MGLGDIAMLRRPQSVRLKFALPATFKSTDSIFRDGVGRRDELHENGLDEILRLSPCCSRTHLWTLYALGFARDEWGIGESRASRDRGRTSISWTEGPRVA